MQKSVVEKPAIKSSHPNQNPQRKPMAFAYDPKKHPSGANANVTWEIVRVTPEMAQSWLGQNVHNRKASARIIAKYARDMKHGHWQMTGDAIRFDTNHRLLDGQHRLQACIASDTTFETLVVYNLPPKTQDVMDSGKSRTAGDVLQLNGMVNTSTLSSVARLLLLEKNHQSGSTQMVKPSTSDILAMVNRHPCLHLYCLSPGTTPPGVNHSFASAINYVASKCLNTLLPERAEAMVAVLKSGVPDYDGDPMHVLRERMLRMTKEVLKVTPEVKWNTFKYAWNAFAKQRPLQSLKIQKAYVEIDDMKTNAL